MRYGEYSKAGEFAYDFPFLWGSKRTGPDLARIGKKYPDAWHYRHFEDPRKFHPKSNMPAYGWLKDNTLKPEKIRNHMDTLDFPYAEEEISPLADKTEMDAIVAYMQVIGTAVTKKAAAEMKPEIIVEDLVNPLAGDGNAIAAGKALFEESCSVCHGDNGEGDIGPSLVDNILLNAEGDMGDAYYLAIITNGLEEGMELGGRTAENEMPPFGEELSKDEMWSIITFIRSMQGK
jgi:cytochrome c oxidase cbb3-type subunit 2